ncbi:MAG TPA: hypothetical protein VH138_15305 [Vicinamibacterales bacterium]|nr:hypothetical protein [Vicinamibacterales bacterium]
MSRSAAGVSFVTKPSRVAVVTGCPPISLLNMHVPSVPDVRS